MRRWLWAGLVMLMGCIPTSSGVKSDYTLMIPTTSNPGDGMLFVSTTELRGTEISTFKRELVYAGHDGQTIFLLYREYVNGIVRPGFAQEFVFDLSEGKEIQIGPWQIEIIEASNKRIGFKVLSDNGVSQRPSTKGKAPTKKKSGPPKRTGS